MRFTDAVLNDDNKHEHLTKERFFQKQIFARCCPFSSRLISYLQLTYIFKAEHEVLLALHLNDIHLSPFAEVSMGHEELELSDSASTLSGLVLGDTRVTSFVKSLV